MAKATVGSNPTPRTDITSRRRSHRLGQVGAISARDELFERRGLPYERVGPHLHPPATARARAHREPCTRTVELQLVVLEHDHVMVEGEHERVAAFRRTFEPALRDPTLSTAHQNGEGAPVGRCRWWSLP